MKNFRKRSKWLAIAGLVGVIYLTESRLALAQTEKSQPKKMKVKIIQNLNGVETMRDTVIEFSGDLPMPDMKEIRKHVTKFSALKSKDSELLLRELRENGKLEEIRKFESVLITEGLPKEMNVRVFKNLSGQEVKIDSLFRNRMVKLEGLEELVNLNKENLRFKVTELEALKMLDGKTEFQFFSSPCDSLASVKRIIILKHELTPAEKEMLQAKAKEKASAGKIKSLELEPVNVYPNPNPGRFRVIFRAPRKANTSVAILDNAGKEIYQEELGIFGGNYEKEFNLEGQPKGFYFLRIMQGKEVFHKKVLLQ